MAKRTAPEQRQDGWQTAGLEEVGIDPQIIVAAIDSILAGATPGIHSLLIVKNDYLVFEQYFSGYAWDYDGDLFRGKRTDFGIDTLHNTASVTKSVTSALVGIAIDHGCFSGVNDKIFAFFPEYADLNDARKERLSLHHLLTMTSGLEWNEMDRLYSDPENDLIQLLHVSDPREYILSKPVVAEPGEKWYYNSGGTNLVGEMIRKATGMGVDIFADRFLFAPLEIFQREWESVCPDMLMASGNLKLRARDMAKFGYLFLKGGTWQGKQVISPEWIAASIRSYAAPEGADGYGYHWWLDKYIAGSTSIDSFYAAGWGGQRIVVFPGLDAVVVFTGGSYVGDEPVDEILTRFILPAMMERMKAEG